MKALVQRVKFASCTVNEKLVSKIDKGLLVFIGFKTNDNKNTCNYIIKKIKNIRIFEDENQKTNLSLKDVNGSILLISQFTLYGSVKDGNRPSFIEALKPDLANELYEYVYQELKKDFITEKGIFGADMKINLLNDGPFTLIIEKEE